MYNQGVYIRKKTPISRKSVSKAKPLIQRDVKKIPRILRVVRQPNKLTDQQWLHPLYRCYSFCKEMFDEAKRDITLYFGKK